MSLQNEKVYFLDLQTTGAKPPYASILEMAWGVSNADNISSYIFHQQMPIPRQIQILTGILEKDLETARDWQDVFKDFHNFISAESTIRPLVVIHFAQFEKKFLEDVYARLEQELPFDIVCTHEIAKRLLPNLPTRGLKGLAGYFGYPSQELKRASSHVHATQEIWRGLVPLMEAKGFRTLTEIKQWLLEKEKTKKGKYEYPLAKEKRLALPKKPGVYRMVSRWGEVLYVGKATSLRDRVNSYFRGQKNRDSRKLEMLTQVWDLVVTPVETPLEAALLETDEIKKLNPRYNISLKTGRRTLAFFNKDFTSIKGQSDSEHIIGPFPNALTLDSMLRLRKSLISGHWDEHMFFDPFTAELIQSGFEVFCQRHQFKSQDFKEFRNILAVGLNWYRKIKDTLIEDVGEENLEGDQNLSLLQDENEPKAKEVNEGSKQTLPSFDDLATQLSVTGELKSLDILEDEDANDKSTDTSLSPEEMADKFERHFIRAAVAYNRSKKMTKLLNSKVEIKKGYFLKIQNGCILDASLDWAPQQNSWQGHSIETYDRMSVLLSELNKIKDL